MEEDKQKPKTTLHFTRIRAVDEPTFFDAQADFRGVLPAVARLTMMFLEDSLGEEHPRYKDITYLHQCFNIFGIRIMEDPQPLEHQVSEFFNAIRKCDKESLFIWMSGFMRLLFSLYGLFCRRDVKASTEEFRGMLEYARFMQYEQVLGKELYEQVKDRLKQKDVFKEPQNKVTESGKIYCTETEEYLHGVQNLARLFMSVEGDKSWESMAEACDAYFSTPGRKSSDQQKIVAALAYPDYKHPFLTAEQEVDTE